MNKIVDENYLDLIIDNSLLRDQINENNTTRLNDMYSFIYYWRILNHVNLENFMNIIVSLAFIHRWHRAGRMLPV